MKTQTITSILSFLLILVSLSGYSQCCNANFTANPETGLQWKFTPDDASTASNISWKWEFGDGAKSSSKSPSHKYYKTGTYWVKLTKTISYGDSLVSTCSIKKPIRIFKHTPPDCFAKFTTSHSGNSYVFTNKTTVVGTNKFASWDFGDGTQASSWNAYHTYTTPGNYLVRLTVRVSSNNCYDSCTSYQQVVISDSCNAGFSKTIHQNIVTVAASKYTNISSWNFGDGQVASGMVASHTYSAKGTYQVCHFVSDSITKLQCQTCQSVVIDSLPIQDTCRAEFYEQQSGNTLYLYSQNNSHTSNSFWRFGDGFYSQEANPIHTFLNPGTYEVCHITRKANYDSCKSCKTFVIESINDTCRAGFSQSINQRTASFNSYFQASRRFSFWQFGDGTTSYESNPVHQYGHGGSYNVCHYTSNDSTNFLNNINACYECHYITIDSTNTECNSTFYYQRSGNTIYTSGAALTQGQNSYYNFGDGSYGTGVYTNHSYTSPGTYTICRYVYNPQTPFDSCQYCLTVTIPDSNKVCNSDFMYHIVNDSLRVSAYDPSNSHVWSFSNGQYGFNANAAIVLNNQQGEITVCHSSYTNVQDSCHTCKVISLSKPTVNPNPASDHINITSNTELLHYYLLSDMNGNTVIYQEGLSVNQAYVTISNITSGMYSLRVGYGNNNIATYSILIQH